MAERKSDPPKDAGRYAVVVRSDTPASAAPPPEATDAKTIRNGRYILLRTLGEGSQGETYEAIDRGTAPHNPKDGARTLTDQWQRYVRSATATPSAPAPPPNVHLVAIKCFRMGKAKAWKDVELAEREARTLAVLDHPRLPKYIEHFEEDGALYLVMEKIEGESLAAIHAKKRTWSHDEVKRMLEDIGDALNYLHGRTPFIVHRDIKPGNIIRRPDGSFALVDFGAVRDRLKLQGGSTIVGTFGYMAPEQFQGRASPKSDVYGVGATALWMLTGEQPEDLPHEGLGIDLKRALPSNTPPAFVRALSAMLTPDPDRRVNSVDEALAFLRAESKAPASPPPSRLRRDDDSDQRSRSRTRKEQRAQRKEEKHEARTEKRRLRHERRGRATPFVPRLVAKLGLLIAQIVVMVVVGFVAPLILLILSLIGGGALRRAAAACGRSAQRAAAALGRASDFLSGHRQDDDQEPQTVIDPRAQNPERRRILAELDQIRILDSSPRAMQERAMKAAEREAKNADQFLDERLEDLERDEIYEPPAKKARRQK